VSQNGPFSRQKLGMNAETFIENAIEIGQRSGWQALNTVQRFVFAISEAEVYCDKDGINSLIDHYGMNEMEIFADAFKAVGANEIANVLSNIARSPAPLLEDLLSLANNLITQRNGYS
jgi:hypothetical protein